MGWEHREVQVRITCRVSRHNSKRDVADDALTDELTQRVQDAVKPIAEDPRYADLILDTEGLDG